jgi:Amt family ammonium transporter
VPGLIEGNAGQVLTQLWGTLATIAYCAAVTWIILFAIRKTIGLRVDEKTETVGLDIALHGQRAYEM